ncbi:MAG: YIP1 family protein [Clostridia bacterium]|nr:YIP1 family protein [Clostridia bacterium]MBO4886540.1 YIP1 family protein [Clostridia bacterium]MBR4442830.1 YIP1 family protein [Clostridia bacterium]
MTNTSCGAGSRHPALTRYFETLRYALHVIVRPFDGFWDLSREGRGSLAAANTIILLALVTRVLKLQYTSFQFLIVHWENVNVLREMLSIYLPLLIWCCANWCWTTLFDGKGSFRDVYMGMGYAVTPYVLLQLPMILLSNILTAKEGAFWGVLHIVSLIWCAGLFVVAMMQIHDFSLGKTILFTIMSLFGMLIIVFLLLLFFSLLSDAVGYFVALYREIMFRMN